MREQFYLDSMQVERFVKTGNEQHILTEIRAGFRNLDRLLLKNVGRNS